MTEQKLRNVVIIGFEGNTALDLVGAADTFHAASYLADPRPYRTIIASVDGRGFRSNLGLQVIPECALDEIDAIDTLILPGGAGLRNPDVGEPIAEWIRANHGRIRRVTSVCTGLFGLAATGLLDGRRAATHWRFAAQLASLHPQIEIDPDAIFVRDGKFITSAGVTAGIDLALALIEEDLGPAAALAVARELVVFVKRPGGQRQFSDILRFEAANAPRLRDFGHYIQTHLDADLGVEELAARANLSVRHFTRLFRQTLGVPPGEFVEQMRLGEAVRRLTGTDAAVDRVAYSIGFRSADAFARAFRRQFGVTPSDYRDRFSSVA
ncbi:GlxA family transcriptional regulator [Sphingomonas sp.]|uniref:GlxA family transcriptional regulator n=1 Tax=Sphingomonas sp. TaxID=28214 RepID=UPI00389F51A3